MTSIANGSYFAYPPMAFPTLKMCEGILREIGQSYQDLYHTPHMYSDGLLAVPDTEHGKGFFRCYKIVPLKVAVEQICDKESIRRATGKIWMDSLTVNHDNCVELHDKVTRDSVEGVQMKAMAAKGYHPFTFCYKPEEINAIAIPIDCPEPVASYKFLENDFAFALKGNKTVNKVFPNVLQFSDLLEAKHPSVDGDDYDYDDHYNEYTDCVDLYGNPCWN